MSYVNPMWGKCVNQKEVRENGDSPIYESDLIEFPALKAVYER